MRTVATALILFLVTSPIFAQTNDPAFGENARFLFVGDSFINASDEWAALVDSAGEFGAIEIVAQAGWPLVNNIRNAALSNYDPNEHDVVVVAGGVNDIADGRDAAQMQAATQAIIDDTRQGGGHTIVLTVTPFRQVEGRGAGGSPSFFTEAREDIAEEYDAWARSMADTASDVSLFDLRAILDPDGDGNADLSLIRGGNDLLHPDATGSQVIADAFIEQFAGESTIVDPPTPPANSVITQVVTSGGSTGDTGITGAGTDLTLLSFVAGGITYDSPIGLPVNDDTPAETLWVVDTTPPASDSAALSDANFATGTLNNGTGAIFDLTGQTLDAETTIYIFGNGQGSVVVDPDTGNATTGVSGATPPGNVNFRDSTGAVIGSVAADFWFQDPGTNQERAPNLISTNLARGNGGNNLNNRTISGAIFTLADITFTTGGIADLAGFSISSSQTDLQDVGIAFPAQDAPGLPGDFDGNGVVDCDDLDGYVGNIGAAATGQLALLDLDGNGTLEATDADTHISTLVVTSNGVVGTFPGDLNCDGQVNVLGDAFALISSLGNPATSYSQGDINFDGAVDVLGDAFVLIANLNSSNGP